MTENVTNETTAESTEGVAETNAETTETTESENLDQIKDLFEDKKEETEETEEKTEGDAESKEVKYTNFELPDDYKLSDDDVTKYHERGKKFNMSQEDLQADINERMDIQKQAVEAHQKVITAEERAEKKGWKESLEKDPVLGGKNMNQSLTNVDKMAHKYGGKEGFDALIESGMAINPHMVRMLNNIAKLVGDDEFVESEGGGTKAKTWEEKFNSAYEDKKAST